IGAVGAAMQDEGLGIRGLDHLSGLQMGWLNYAAAGRFRSALLRSALLRNRCSTMAPFTTSLWVSGSMWPAPSMVWRRPAGRPSARTAGIRRAGRGEALPLSTRVGTFIRR